MYTIRLFQKNLCKHADYSKCSGYNIWGWRKRFPFNILPGLIDYLAPCDEDNFPYIYWYVLLMTVFGLLMTIYEFITVYHGTTIKTSFRTRRYRVLPRVMRRNGRLIGSAIMCKLYVLLLIGVACVLPEFMNPWLTVQALIFLLEIFFWIIDVLIGEESSSLLSIIIYFLLYYNWVLVWCIKHTLETLNENNIKIN